MLSIWRHITNNHDLCELRNFFYGMIETCFDSFITPTAIDNGNVLQKLSQLIVTSLPAGR